MHPTQHRKSHGHVQPAARASFSLSMTLQEHRACVRLQNLSAKQWPEQRSSPPTSAIASSEQRPEQRSAHSAKQWPAQRSSPHSVNHPLPETLSVAVRKKSAHAVRGLTTMSNSAQMTATVRTSHHARSTTRSS